MKNLFFILIFLISFNAKAISFEDAVFPELATSARALAMGNAFISKVDDASAAFYNPAGLGTVRYAHFHLSNFQFELNKGLIEAGTGGQVSDATTGISKMLSLDGIRQLLVTKPGTIAHSSFHALPNFTSRYFSIGYLYSKKTRATVTDAASATGFEFADRLDMGPYAAINLSLFGGVFKAGASGVLLKRKEIITTANPNSTLSLTDSNYNSGLSAIVTVGGKITLPITFLPAVALTMHNASSSNFSKDSGSAGAPTTIPSSYDVGLSITPQVGMSSRIHLEVNFKDFAAAYTGVAMTRRIVFGAELDFSRVFFFRIGYGDGFGSGGLGIKSKNLEFDLTTYAVDTSGATYRGKEDRRFAISISSGF